MKATPLNLAACISVAAERKEWVAIRYSTKGKPVEIPDILGKDFDSTLQELQGLCARRKYKKGYFAIWRGDKPISHNKLLVSVTRTEGGYIAKWAGC